MRSSIYLPLGCVLYRLNTRGHSYSCFTARKSAALKTHITVAIEENDVAIIRGGHGGEDVVDNGAAPAPPVAVEGGVTTAKPVRPHIQQRATTQFFRYQKIGYIFSLLFSLAHNSCTHPVDKGLQEPDGVYISTASRLEPTRSRSKSRKIQPTVRCLV